MLKIGILGVGAIGHTIAGALDQKQIDAELVALSDQDRVQAETFSSELSNRPPAVSIDEMMQVCDLVVEAASQAALLDFVPKALVRGRDMLIMSVGGLLGHEEWFRQARETGCRIHIPSGAIAGLDGIKSASIGHIESVLLISRKPVAALQGSRYVVERNLPLDSFKEDTVIFEGFAEEAARAFPGTSNVAASLRLAVDSVAPVPVRVQIVAVPRGKENAHEIHVKGEFGRFSVKIENVPSRRNPRTSQLAAFSAIATLKNLTRSLHVGT
jgi:aspartate dehydrogenase